MIKQEILKSGEKKPTELKERFLVLRPFDVELYQEGKETVTEVFRQVGSGGLDIFSHTKKDGKNTFTRIKPGSQEPESITNDVFEKVCGKESNPRVEYEKYAIDYGNGCSIDYLVYRGFPRIFSVAEVQFEDEEKANAFAPPTWFGEPITGNPDFDNYSIAAKGVPA